MKVCESESQISSSSELIKLQLIILLDQKVTTRARSLIQASSSSIGRPPSVIAYWGKFASNASRRCRDFSSLDRCSYCLSRIGTDTSTLSLSNSFGTPAWSWAMIAHFRSGCVLNDDGQDAALVFRVASQSLRDRSFGQSGSYSQGRESL
jgi:hypothetical protein